MFHIKNVDITDFVSGSYVFKTGIKALTKTDISAKLLILKIKQILGIAYSYENDAILR